MPFRLRSKTFRGGTRVPHRKNTSGCATIKTDLPVKVIIPMLQHIGAPCVPVVAKGDAVKVGQVIGNSEKYVSSPVHSSVSGTVSAVTPLLYAGGGEIMSVEITTDGKQEIHESIKPPQVTDRKSFVGAVAASGLVGLGGAGFPTHVKLSPPPGMNIDTLIINGAECEPYITSDFREMVENAAGITEGIGILLEMMQYERVIIGIEDNKPEAINIISNEIIKNEILRTKTAGGSRISVVPLKSRYPQGAEKMLIYALTGRKVPSGKLPADVGTLVMNVNSVSFIAAYMKTGMPLIRKRVTVDGSAVARPGNYDVLIGTPLSDVFAASGGFKTEPAKILMGGPMMGIAQYSLQTSVLKHTNALLAFDVKEATLPAEIACIRCGKCVYACPVGLLPLYINLHVLKKNTDEIAKYKANDCIECGCCSYVCPAKRRLVQSIRLGKAILKNSQNKAKAGK